MDLVAKLKTKKENMLDILDSLTTMKKVKLFEDEISEMASDNFSIPMQISILNKVLNIEINYNTYYTYYNKNIRSKRGVEATVKKDNKKDSSPVQSDSDYNELKKRYDKLKELIVERERILELNTKLDKTKSSQELLDEAKSFITNIPKDERSEIKNIKSLFIWINKKIIELTKEKLELEVKLEKLYQTKEY